jgi:hypothetical protein
MNEGSFSRAIEAHLELQRRNRRLESAMPIDRYREDVGHSVAAREPRPGPGDAAAAGAAPWDDPDSWWNVHEPPVGSLDWRG